MLENSCLLGRAGPAISEGMSHLTEERFDFAVTGDSLFAALLALALARQHARRVCLIGQLPAPLQIARDLTLATGPYTRPETLRLLASGRKDLSTLLPANAFERRDVTFSARSADGWTAAGHVRQMLSGLAMSTALLSEDADIPGFNVHGVWTLKPRVIFAALPDWLELADVAVFDAVEDLRVGQNSVRFAAGHHFVTADRIIVTNGHHAPSLPSLPAGVTQSGRMALLTNPVPALANRLIVDIETSGFIIGRADGRLEALAPSDAETDAIDWLAGFLPPGAETTVIAHKRIPVLVSTDGGPMVAPLSHKAALVATGFGVGAGFLAPALAGYLVDAASTDQAAWFAARCAGAGRRSVSDVGYVGGGTP